MELFKRIFSLPELINAPPVLIDIGASETIHAKWKQIAEYSICIAFDADEREFSFIEKKSSGFRNLYIYNCIVSDKKEDKIDFYLTKSPYCSSTLEPDNEALNQWSFADKFEVEKKISLNNTTLSKVLNDLNINRVDWFKTDSQGIDLRLFKNLPLEIQDKVIVAEFEPGFIDAYKGEDKLYDILKYMDEKNFWISDFITKGAHKLEPSFINSFSKNDLNNKLVSFSHRRSPGWAEVTYINAFNSDLSMREYLLGWVFSIVHKQYGFSYKLANSGKEKFGNTIFEDLSNYSLKRIKANIYKLGFAGAFLEKIKKQFQNS